MEKERCSSLMIAGTMHMRAFTRRERQSNTLHKINVTPPGTRSWAGLFNKI